MAQSLFGMVDPASVQQSLQLEQQKNLMAQANMDPAAYLRYSAGLQGQQAGQAVGQLFGLGQTDPRLKQASDAQAAYQEALAASGGDATTAEFFKAFANSAAKRNLGPLAQQAAQQAFALRPSKTDSKVVPPGAALLDANGNVLFQNPKENPVNVKTVDLGDRVEYYQEGTTTPFKTEKKGESPTTSFRRELEAVKAEDKQNKQQVAAEQSISHATKVLQDVGEAKSLVGPWTTGGVGGVAQFLPQTDARKLSNKIKTIKANLGFDRLQQMRDASPTGGALGQVAVQEINFLQSVVATLDQLESQDDILQAFGKIEEHYQNWLNAVRGRNPAAAQATGGVVNLPLNPNAPPATRQNLPLNPNAPAAQTVPLTTIPKGVTVRKVN